jgi:uncharacterized protein YbjQ (UPF0145 family)
MGLFSRLTKAGYKFLVYLFTPTGRQPAVIQNRQRQDVDNNPVSIQPGKTPDIASHRINSQKQVGNNFFTSDLSCNEYLLTREAGCEPIGVVMGTCFYKVGFYGYFRGFQNFTGELKPLSQAQLAARELAVVRMQQEAAMLGAQGIIGVRLKKSRQGWGTGVIEFTAIGTAIRVPGRPPTSQPFTSDLSGQEFWQLYKAGYWPKGLVFGACSYYVHSDRQTRNITNPSSWNRLSRKGQWLKNQEMIQFTEGFQASRDIAVARMSEEALQLGAEGTVGMHIETDIEKIDYQPFNSLGCLVNLLSFSLIPVFIYVFSVAPNAGYSVLFFTLIVLVFVLRFAFSIVSSLFSNNGVYRDLLANFVVIGTAIIHDKDLPQNSAGKTLMYYPLSKN